MAVKAFGVASKMKDFYHFTTKVAAFKFIAQRKIEDTSGKGVYGSLAKKPVMGKVAMACTNWDGHGKIENEEPCVFKIRVHIKKIRKLDTESEEYVHAGDINLDDYDWTCYGVTECYCKPKECNNDNQTLSDFVKTHGDNECV